MEVTHSVPCLGQIVEITHGREKGQYMIVIKHVDDRYVLLADGEKRKYDRPKKKNILHFQEVDDIATEVQTSLLETGRVTNGKLRFAMEQFFDKLVTDERKGVEPDDERRAY